MAKTEHYFTRLEPNGFYHIYNRTVDKVPMFTKPSNYQFFLNRMKKYLIDVLDVYAYCLLNNHFHLLVAIKEHVSCEMTSHAFQRMFQSYAMAFNKQERRAGTLFQTPFKRAEVTSEEYFMYLIWYIHANPQRHGLVRHFQDWQHSSYRALVSDKATLLKRESLIEKFDGLEGFVAFHNTFQEELEGFATLEDW